MTYKYKCIIYKWVQSYNYAVLERKCHTANSMNICYCCSAYSQAYLLSGNSVDFVLFAKCLCSHNTTPHLPLPSMHIPTYSPFISYTHFVSTLHLLGQVYNQSITSPYPKSPGTQNTTHVRHLKTLLWTWPETL